MLEVCIIRDKYNNIGIWNYWNRGNEAITSALGGAMAGQKTRYPKTEPEKPEPEPEKPELEKPEP